MGLSNRYSEMQVCSSEGRSELKMESWREQGEGMVTSRKMVVEAMGINASL